MVSYALVCLTLLALSSQHFLANADLITEICDKAVNKDVCKSLFAETSNAKNENLDGLAMIALKSAAKHATGIHNKIQELATDEDIELQQRLNDCSESYQDAIDQFAESESALKAKNYVDVNTWVSAAMSDGQECEEGFKVGYKKKSPLTDLYNEFSGICSVAMTITKMLDSKA